MRPGASERRREIADGVDILAVAAQPLRDLVPADFAHAGTESLAPARHLVGDLHRPLAFGHDHKGHLEALACCGLKLHDVEAGRTIARHADNLARRGTELGTHRRGNSHAEHAEFQDAVK